MKKNIFKLIYIILCLVGTNLIINFTSQNPLWVENIYSRNIYLRIMNILSNISGLFPFSLTELFICLFVILFVYTLYLLIRKFSVTKLIGYLLNIFSILCSIVILFWIFWGINNFRLPIENSMPFNKEKHTVAELEKTCYALLDKANELRDEIGNADTVALYDGGYKDIFQNSKIAYKKVSQKYSIISPIGKIKPKPMVFSKAMSMLNFTGMYCAITGEANINVHEPIMDIPFTVCHELAHLKGFPKENEANFISFLTCINSDDSYFQYSGYLSGLIYCTNALYREDPQAYIAIKNKYSAGLIKDLTYINEYWSEYKGFFASLGETNNNVFLKFTNQPEGTKSYGLVVDLIISYYIFYQQF